MSAQVNFKNTYFIHLTWDSTSSQLWISNFCCVYYQIQQGMRLPAVGVFSKKRSPPTAEIPWQQKAWQLEHKNNRQEAEGLQTMRRELQSAMSHRLTARGTTLAM